MTTTPAVIRAIRNERKETMELVDFWASPGAIRMYGQPHCDESRARALRELEELDEALAEIVIGSEAAIESTTT